MRTIFHITTENEWQTAQKKGFYECPSLEKEGLIHFSRPHQLLRVANANFKNQSKLLLLFINQDKITAEIKYEGSEHNKFPHVYGRLNLDAVINTFEFKEDAHGFFLPNDFKLVGNTLIRKGQPGDESEIASVHCHAWLQSYKGIIPDSYLDSIPLSYRRRYLWWRDIVNEKKPLTVYVAESEKDGIIAFCESGPARDNDFHGYAEIGALYSLKEYKNKGIGSALFDKTTEFLKSTNYKQMCLWSLKDNPTIEFYKNKGGKMLDKEKIDNLGKPLTEVAFEWTL